MASTRRRSWADVLFNVTALVAGVKQDFDLLANAPATDTRTVVRILGDLWVMYSPNSTIVDSLSVVNLGIGVSSVEAFAAGGVSLPNPANPTQFPPRGWLYVNSQPVSQQAESNGVVNTWAHFAFDLGAMRKIDKGSLFLSMQQDDILVGGSMRVVGRTRALCLT